MAIPILSRRRERHNEELKTAIEEGIQAGVEKAMLPAVAQAGQSGATYAVNPSSPFNQTGGMVPGYVPLPRNPDDFNSGFGPGFPFVPDALDMLGPAGRVMPRRAQYLVAQNLQLDANRRTPWTALRWLAEECDIVARCINLVQDGMLGRDWSWGFSDSIIEQIMTEENEQNHARAMAIAKDKYGTELDRVKQFFEYPDQRSKHNFSQFLSEIIYQCLVFDGVCIFPQRTLGGDLMSLNVIDTSTIKILIDNQGFPPQPPSPAYQQILYGFPRSEFQASRDDSEAPDAEFASDQLAYYIRRPRPGSVYGYPPTEEVMTIATTYLARQAWMSAEYAYGAMPKTFFKMGENSTWTPEQTFGYEQQFNDRLSGQVNRRQMAFLLPNGMDPIFSPQVDEKYKNDYDSFLITQIGSKFGVPSSQLGVQAKAGLSGGRQMEGESDQTEHFTTGALVNFFIDILNDLARRFLGVGPEITATSQDDGDSKEDVVQQANADKTVIGFGGITINDYRAERGLPLYDMPEADEPFILTATGPTFLKGTLAVQDANTQNTLNPPPPPTKVVLGPDGKPLPDQGAPDGSSSGSDSADNGGRESVPSGDGKSQAGSDGSAGPGGKSGPSDGNEPTGNTVLSVPAPTIDQSDRLDANGHTKPTGSTGAASDATKELAAFVNFAKSRGGKSWRPFEFVSTVGRLASDRLNELGATGDLELIKATVGELHAAGLVVKANDTGRVLLVQRSIDNHNKLAAGLWEWPGGCIDNDTDTAWETAQREWEEEVGVDLPKGKVAGSWSTPDGRYTAFVYVIKHESDIDLSETRNAFDGSGDGEIENVAWWNINDLQNNSATRAELQSADWSLLATAKKSVGDGNRPSPKGLATKGFNPDEERAANGQFGSGGISGGSSNESGAATGHVTTDASPTEAARAVNDLADRAKADFGNKGDYDSAPKGESKSVEANRAELIAKTGSTGQDIVDGVKDYTGAGAAHENGPYMKTLLEATRNAPLSDRALFRGMSFEVGDRGEKNTELMDKVSSLQAGDTIPLRGSSSFSSSSSYASNFSDSPSGGVQFELQPGARALNITGISNTPRELESLVAGELRVVSVEKVPQGFGSNPTYQYHVKVAQV